MPRIIVSMVFMLCGVVAANAAAPDAESVAKATAAATAWLALVDAGKYAASWHHASARFQSSIAQTAWQRAVGPVRDPLGKVVERKLTSAVFTHTLPGVPDGDYVVIRYATRFEHKADAIETITPARESDGSWKVSGYFVK